MKGKETICSEVELGRQAAVFFLCPGKEALANPVPTAPAAALPSHLLWDSLSSSEQCALHFCAMDGNGG